MTMELKRCPFCGSKKVAIRETAYGNYKNIWFYAICDSCHSRSGGFRDGDKAAEAWNMRIRDIEFEKQFDELRRQNDFLMGRM